jgi:hypothetical protein
LGGWLGRNGKGARLGRRKEGGFKGRDCRGKLDDKDVGLENEIQNKYCWTIEGNIQMLTVL